MTRSGLVLALTVASTGLPTAAFAGTCALCRQALASGGNQGLIQGFYWSIVLIAGVPLVIMGTVGLLVWRSTRLKRRTDAPGLRRPLLSQHELRPAAPCGLSEADNRHRARGSS